MEVTHAGLRSEDGGGRWGSGGWGQESCAELLWHGEPRPRRTAAAGEAAHEGGASAGNKTGIRTAGCSGWAREPLV